MLILLDFMLIDTGLYLSVSFVIFCLYAPFFMSAVDRWNVYHSGDPAVFVFKNVD